MKYQAAVRYLLSLGRELAAPTQAAAAKFDLENITERIRINGEEISDQAFAETLTRIHVLIEELLAAGKLRAHPTYFECVTAMAFEYFSRELVDFAVFEVGLGGRLDATNILSPLVSIIT